MAHHLGFEAVGQDVVHVVPHHVARDRVDAVLRFQDVARRTVLLLDRQQLRLAALLKQVFKRGVEGVLLVQRGVRRAAFVQDLQRRPVVHRIHDPVHVDQLAKPLVRALLAVALGDQRCAGEGDARGVGKRLEQVLTQVRALCAVRLVDHQHDAAGRVHHTKGLARRHGQVRAQRLGHRVAQRLLLFLKFVHHHHVDVRAVAGQLLAQRLAAFDHVHLAADQRGRVGQLAFQVGAVVDQHDLVVAQVAAGAQHARQKHHGQRLARALRVPHHATALQRRLAAAQPLHHLARCAELLVAAHHLHPRAAVRVHAHRAGAQNLQQVAVGQHARHQLLLRVQAGQRRVVLRVQRLPAVEMFFF